VAKVVLVPVHQVLMVVLNKVVVVVKDQQLKKLIKYQMNRQNAHISFLTSTTTCTPSC
jgi:hypothetical protein